MWTKGKAQYLGIVAIALSLTTAISASADNPNDILVIANKRVPVNAATLDEIRSIFLKKQTQWKAGHKAVPVFHGGNDKLHREFLNRVLEMDLFKEQAYWDKAKIMTGTRPPPKFRNPLKAVFSLIGAVGYIYRSEYREGVAKILMVIPAK